MVNYQGKKTYHKKGFIRIFKLIPWFQVCWQSHKCYKPTVEPLFPGVGLYVGVVVGFRVLVGIMVVSEFFIIVGTVVSTVPFSEVTLSLVEIIG